MILEHVALLFISLLISGFSALFVMKYGEQLGLYDAPNGRSSHKNIVPAGGGVGIIGAFVLSSMILVIPIYFWLPVSIVAVVSLWSDKIVISPLLRLINQFVCCFIFIICFFYSQHTSAGVYLLSIPISVFIVGTSNFYNFMDGIDGIAGITGVIAFSFLAGYIRLKDIPGPNGIICMVVVVSCLVFLLFNFPRSKIFMGDVGSVPIGFIFGCMAIILSKQLIDFLIIAGFLFPFYFDALFTMGIRIRRRESLFKAHRKHIYQLLANELEIVHWKVSLLYALIQIIVGITALIVGQWGMAFVLASYAIYSVVFLIIAMRIRKAACL